MVSLKLASVLRCSQNIVCSITLVFWLCCSIFELFGYDLFLAFDCLHTDARPTPLSSALHRHQGEHVVTRAMLLNTVLDKVHELNIVGARSADIQPGYDSSCYTVTSLLRDTVRKQYRAILLLVPVIVASSCKVKCESCQVF